MGSSVSRADPPTPDPTPVYPPSPPYAIDVPSPLTHPVEGEKAAAEEEKVDYLNLGVPLPYEEIQRESYSKTNRPSRSLIRGINANRIDC